MRLTRSGKIVLAIVGGIGLTVLGLFSFRLVKAGLDWEVQPPPESYQTAPVRFNGIDFVRNEYNGKYYGWIVGNKQPGAVAGQFHDTFLYYTGSYWQTASGDPFSAGAQDLLAVDAVYDSSTGLSPVWAVGRGGRYWFFEYGIPQTCPPRSGAHP